MDKPIAGGDQKRAALRIGVPSGFEWIDICVIYPARQDYDRPWPAGQAPPRFVAHSLETDQLAFGQTPIDAYEELLCILVELMRHAQQSGKTPNFTPAPPEIRARYTESHRLPLDIQRLAIDRAKARMYPTAQSGNWRELDIEPPLPDELQLDSEVLNDDTGGSYYDLILIKSSTTVSIESSAGVYACS